MNFEALQRVEVILRPLPGVACPNGKPFSGGLQEWGEMIVLSNPKASH